MGGERFGRVGTLVVTTAVVVGMLAACSGDDGGDEAAEPEAAAPTTTEPVTTTTAAPAMSTRSVPITTEAPADLPGYNVRRPVDLAEGAPHPVIVWANGGCVRYDDAWRALLERWASAGFVVISITTPSPDHPPASSTTTADDQAAAIDWAEAHPAHLDLDRVVAAGNSCGGITSLGLAGQDDRVKAVFVLSGSSVGPGATRAQASAVMRLVHVPVGFAVGGPTDIARPQAEQDYDVLPAGVPAMVTERDEGDHPFVSTNAGTQADAAEIALNWMDLVLYGTPAALEAVNDPPDRWTVTAKHLDTLLSG